MFIQTKYRIGMGIAIIVGMSLMASVYLLSREIRNNLNAESQVLMISERLAEMLGFTADYVAYPRERILNQWETDVVSLKALLLSARENKYIDKDAVQRLEHQVNVIDDFMWRLVEIRGAEDISGDKVLRDRILDGVAGRLREEVRRSFDIALGLAHDHRTAVIEYTDLTRYFYMSMFVILLCLAAAATIWVNRAILAPINNLRKQTHIIAKGHLGHRINSDSSDEIGLLSKDFDLMTNNLQRTMISRDELENIVILRTEDMIKAKELAEKASESKTKFLSGMSHELRTPLNAVLGFAQVLEVHEGLDDESRESVNEILQAGQHLLSLINDVLEISKIDQDRISIEIADVSVYKIVNTATSFLTGMAKSKGIVIESFIEQTIMVRADPVRFKQVMINILSNAIKYNKKDGRVKIYAESTAAGMVDICIADSGQGIPEGMFHKVFEPFERLSDDPYAVEGVGIGMAITKRLVEGMGGELSFVSNVGKGSTFRVRLKLAE